MKKILIPILIFSFLAGCDDSKKYTLVKKGRYETDIFLSGAMEISAYDKKNKRLFITNDTNKTVEVVDIKNIEFPEKIGEISVKSIGCGITSVAVKNGVVVLAIPSEFDDENGKIALYNVSSDFSKDVEPLAIYTVGVLPDMVGISPDGKKICTANEGEPGENIEGEDVDPEGSVSVVSFNKKISIENSFSGIVTNIDFKEFDNKRDELIEEGVRIFDGVDVSKDVEPEYLTFSKDSKKIWVTLQEQNSIAIIDIAKNKIIKLVPLGYKDHSKDGYGLDATETGEINIQTWPVYGMYMPDAVASFQIGKKNYIATANEGDDRGETVDIEDIDLDRTAFPNAEQLQHKSAIGKLEVSSINGDIDGDGDFDKLFSYGARSFSIWDEEGTLVWDSGDQFENTIADLYPDYFNIGLNVKKDKFKDLEKDSRSGNSGPEPEGIAVAEIGCQTLVFIGLEKQGGIMIYDITDPESPEFMNYINSRNYESEVLLNGEEYDDSMYPVEFMDSDLNPEGILFIPESESPSCRPLLVVSYEASGSAVIYEIKEQR